MAIDHDGAGAGAGAAGGNREEEKGEWGDQEVKNMKTNTRPLLSSDTLHSFSEVLEYQQQITTATTTLQK